MHIGSVSIDSEIESDNLSKLAKLSVNYSWEAWLNRGIPQLSSQNKMAGISFLDLMFAEALASGLAREARRAERPPPDNFYLIPRDPNAWRQIQTACKKENMVIAVEITDDRNENCRRVQSLFVDMAREFDNIPFLRVKIALGSTFDEVSWSVKIFTHFTNRSRSSHLVGSRN